MLVYIPPPHIFFSFSFLLGLSLGAIQIIGEAFLSHHLGGVIFISFVTFSLHSHLFVWFGLLDGLGLTHNHDLGLWIDYALACRHFIYIQLLHYCLELSGPIYYKSQ